ncbi:MAG: hypothetical protein QMC38_12300 [Sinobacterium sp.]
MCFKTQAREVVYTLYEFLSRIDTKVVSLSQQDDFPSNHHSVRFEGLEGIRLAFNSELVKGLLEAL